ncbi:tropomyosin isoform X2 [Eurosta solidaginis]|uniref:tropomyosin isoform X2 n=1 Tax=Eurosta solidaginis TaxID=178769 RepID=UPI003530BCB4
MLPENIIDSWNELFADCKMVESDLKNPTEAWLTNVLINYLRMFGYRIVNTSNEDCIRENRLFLIELVRCIDHIYKITDKTFTFTFYDLLRPTPKKTSHMLGILLNYLYYLNLFKTEVFKMASDRLKERQELGAEVKYTVEDNIKRHSKAQQIQEQVDALSKQIPIQRNELKALNSQVEHGKGQLQQKKDAITELGTKIDAFKAQVRNLKRQIVPNDEGQELQTQLVKLQENITECEEQTRNVESNLKTHILDNEKLQELLKMVENAKDILNPTFVENLNETNKKISSTEAQVANYEKEKEQLIQVINRNEKAIKSSQEKLKVEETQYDEEKQRRKQAIFCRTRECDDLASKAASVREEIHAVEKSIKRLQEVQSYIQENVANLMKKIQTHKKTLRNISQQKRLKELFRIEPSTSYVKFHTKI